MSSPTSVETHPIGRRLEAIDDHLRENLPRTAKALGLQFVADHPDNVDGWILLGRAYLALAEYDKVLECGEKAVAIDGKHPAAQLVYIEGLLHSGRSEQAFLAIKKLEKERKNDPVVLLQVGYAYTRTNRHAEAARCYERVMVLNPVDSQVVHSLAGSYIALGDMEKAEAVFDDLLRKRPHDYDGYYNRATLRKQTRERNHIEPMEKVLRELPTQDRGEPVLCYSLGKELEDLKEYKRAFAYLKRGAAVHNAFTNYGVEGELDMMKEVQQQFDAAFFAEHHQGYDAESPIFVLGLPRSGTTLVDRILSSHSTVGSVGESDEFSQAIVRLGPGENVSETPEIKHTRNLDWEKLGREFCGAVNGLLPGYGHLLDKTPRNFYYLGLILTALPNAKIVHLRRHPVDSCYAVFKTLFRRGYPFSYDLEHMGRFYLGYRALMEHWRTVLPGRFLDIDYEYIVASQKAATHKMVDFCGLAWEDTCLEFEKNESPSLTASAAQVRQPIYKTSVALWKRYEEELQPLIRVLVDGGIDIGDKDYSAE